MRQTGSWNFFFNGTGVWNGNFKKNKQHDNRERKNYRHLYIYIANLGFLNINLT